MINQVETSKIEEKQSKISQIAQNQPYCPLKSLLEGNPLQQLSITDQSTKYQEEQQIQNSENEHLAVALGIDYKDTFPSAQGEKQVRPISTLKNQRTQGNFMLKQAWVQDVDFSSESDQSLLQISEQSSSSNEGISQESQFTASDRRAKCYTFLRCFDRPIFKDEPFQITMQRQKLLQKFPRKEERLSILEQIKGKDFSHMKGKWKRVKYLKCQGKIQSRNLVRETQSKSGINLQKEKYSVYPIPSRQNQNQQFESREASISSKQMQNYYKLIENSTQKNSRASFNKVISFKQYDQRSPSIAVKHEAEQYALLLLPKNPSHEFVVRYSIRQALVKVKEPAKVSLDPEQIEQPHGGDEILARSSDSDSELSSTLGQT